jgi:hypothetical protein
MAKATVPGLDGPLLKSIIIITPVSTRIQEVRIALIWFERLTSIWDAATPAAMAFLRSPADYALQFESAGSKGAGETLSRPWPVGTQKYQHWFWTYYLPVAPNSLRGADAFRLQVPLRSGFNGKIACEKPWITAIPDAFFYPHGVGLVVTLKLFLDRDIWSKKGASLETAVQKSIEAYTDYQYELTWDSGTRLQGKLDEIAGDLVRQARERMLAPACPQGSGDPKPFSIAAIVRGTFDSPAESSKMGSDWEHALLGLCTLRAPWQKVNLYPLKDAALRIRHSVPNSHTMYHSERGRALWFPASFADAKKPRKRVVGCYQRNLTLLHLQTTALIEVLKSQADLISGGKNAPPMLSAMALEAANQLSTIYASAGNTYRSSSPRAYIDEHPGVKTLIETTLAKQLTYTAMAT